MTLNETYREVIGTIGSNKDYPINISEHTINVKKAVKIFHIFRRKGDPKGGVMTVATKVHSDGTVHLGFSFCASGESFRKDVGRIKALGRLNSDKHTTALWTGHTSDNIVDVFNNVLRSRKVRPSTWRDCVLVNVKEAGITVVEKL